MGGAVEVVGAKDLNHIGDRVLGQHHAAENGLLGFDIVRWSPLERGIGAAGATWAAGEIKHAHHTPPNTATPVVTRRSDSFAAAAPYRQRELWTCLWITCALPPLRCEHPGDEPGDNPVTIARKPLLSSENVIQALWTKESR
ncbi:hypothetical protein Misp02_51440 [Microtetraspora sp. NBRC 16547]|nr:hypothetical protein Misp02_51440 [Microtetraspora sp. NBRC 16547]